MRVRYAALAQADLIEIAEYIAQDSPTAAERTIGKLRQAARDLAKFPAKFPLVGRRSGRQLRRRPWRSYAIYYVVGEQDVEIVRILHSARDADRILFPED
jgi:toxin ParE1/3/4